MDPVVPPVPVKMPVTVDDIWIVSHQLMRMIKIANDKVSLSESEKAHIKQAEKFHKHWGENYLRHTIGG